MNQHMLRRAVDKGWLVEGKEATLFRQSRSDGYWGGRGCRRRKGLGVFLCQPKERRSKISFAQNKQSKEEDGTNGELEKNRRLSKKTDDDGTTAAG